MREAHASPPSLPGVLALCHFLEAAEGQQIPSLLSWCQVSHSANREDNSTD